MTMRYMPLQRDLVILAVMNKETLLSSENVKQIFEQLDLDRAGYLSPRGLARALGMEMEEIHVSIRAVK